MSYASEKLHKGYLRQKMPSIVSKVKVREIIIHLPCLTDHDRETIEAKRETNGNFDGMVLLLDCLKRRENWPEQLIEALEACEHPTIAADIRAEYNALRGINNSNPSPPSTTVVNAYVHPPPSASQLPIPEDGEKTKSTVTPPKNPVQPQVDQSPPAQPPEAVSLPEPVPEPPESTEIEAAPLPSTPPPSPETQHAPVGTSVPAQREVHAHQEPEENSESDIQDISDDTGVVPEQMERANNMVSSVVTPQPFCPTEQSETERLQTITEVSPPQRPPPCQTQSNVTNQSSFLTRTPEKAPVQDTTPPVEDVPAAVLEPRDTSEPQTAETASTLPAAAVLPFSLTDDGTECLSKPQQLISVQPQNGGSPNIPEVNSVVDPYSGNSERLEISNGAPDTVASACALACSDVTSTVGDTLSGVPCQDYGVILNHNEPQENHYDCLSQTLEIQEVREHVMHVSQEVSIFNLEGQTSAPQAQMFNSETSALTTTTADTTSTSKAHTRENYHPPDPAQSNISPQLPDPDEKETSHIPTKYILTAAGVAAFALLVAWKLRN